jgi:hypothetical protein
MNKLQVLLMAGLLAVSSVAFASSVLTMEIFDGTELIFSKGHTISGEVSESKSIFNGELEITLTIAPTDNKVTGALAIAHKNVDIVSWEYELDYNANIVIKCPFSSWSVTLSVASQESANA